MNQLPRLKGNRLPSRMLLPLACAFLAATTASAKYTEVDSYLNPATTVTMGAWPYKTTAWNDTANFQKAIDYVAANGGGKVIVPADTYRLVQLEMKSDVHLVFEGKSTIYPHAQAIADGATVNLFNLGTNGRIDNVSVRSLGGWSTFKFDNHDKVRAFLCGDVNNFQIANFTVDDTRTTYSSITLTWAGNEANGDPRIPSNGTIKNFRANDADYGYGAIQAHAGIDIFFKNITSVGGVAVRLETGWKQMNLAQSSGLWGISGNNITSIHGQAALMLTAHAMHHGNISFTNVKSTGSEYAVLHTGGSLHKFTDQEIADNNLTEGSFESITVNGVDATYEAGPIVTRWAHLLHFPVELHHLVYEDPTIPGSKQYAGCSIAPVLNTEASHPNFVITNINSHNSFLYHSDMIDESDFFTGSPRTVLNTQ